MVKPSIWGKHLSLLLIGFVFISIAHHEFVGLTVKNKGWFVNKGNENVPREAPKKYVKFKSPWTYLKESIRPPEFYVKGESHIMMDHLNKTYKKRSEGDFWDHPVSYLKWNLGGRLFLLWDWDNSYIGDVYIYHMLRKGFEENSFLKLIHRTMHLIHIPLYLLSLMAPILLFVGWKRKILSAEKRTLLVPVLGFLYFLVVLSFLSWLPRYTIPVRPFSYILAAASLSCLLPYAKNWMNRS